MWKATAGAPLEVMPSGDDDWETDPDFINDVSEQEQRWGSRTVDGSGRTAGSVDMKKLREEVAASDAVQKKKQLDEGPKASFGYGGKFGVQTDRMDQSAVGHDYIGKVEKHVSQKDYSSGFGGKFGVQTDRIDKSAVSWEHKEAPQKHASQTDYRTGFGGKFGVQTDRQDKSAVGWDHVEKLHKHESQIDYSRGFGGKFGVEKDRQDKAAVGWDHVEAPHIHPSQKDYAVGFGGKYGVQADRQDRSAVGWDHIEKVPHHHSQTDHKKGFGGKYGVETDRVDKSAHDFSETTEKIGTKYEKQKPEIGSLKPSNLRAKFENLAKQGEEEARKRAEEERERRKIRDRQEEKEAKEREERRLKQLNDEEQKVQAKEDEPLVESIAEPTPIQVPSPLPPDTTDYTEKMSESKIDDIAADSTVLQNEKEVPVIVPSPTQQPPLVSEETKDDQPVTSSLATSSVPVETAHTFEEEPDEDTGYTAVALYDYQAAADDEISFDPDDLITNIEMIDEGWWRGVCNGQYGLFPANYVILQ